MDRQAAKGGRRMTVRKMTGFGFYGQPHHITKMLAKVLVRYEGVPLAIRPDGLRGNAGAADHGDRWFTGRRWLKGGAARIAEPGKAQLTGFFLSMTEGRAELHFCLRGPRRGEERVTEF